MSAIYIILYISILITFFAVQAKLNLPPNKRYQQFMLPIAAIAYCIAILYLGTDIIEDLEKNIPVKEVKSVFPKLVEEEDNMINGAITLVSVIINFALIAGFIIIKAILLPILKQSWKSDFLVGATSGWFYEDLKMGKEEEENSEQSEEKEKPSDKDAKPQTVEEAKKEREQKRKEKAEKEAEKKRKEEEEIRWVLKHGLEQLKVYYNGFYYGMVTVALIMLFIAMAKPQFSAVHSTFLPCFGVLILGEIVFFLSGADRPKETAKPVEAPKPKAPEAEYDFLRPILKELFDDRTIHDAFTEASLSSDAQAPQLSDSDSHEYKLANAYFSKLASEGEVLNASYVQTTIQLIQGKSALINNPFYKDLTVYLLLPILRHLMNYHKCLIIAGRESAAEDIKQWLDAGLLAATGTNSLWNVEVLTNSPTHADIGILKFSDIYNLDLHRDNDNFLKDVSFVLLIEPSHILATAQMGMSLLVSRCESDGHDIVYCACDRNCDGLVDALSHTLKTNLTEVAATQTGTANCSEMYWNADGSFMHHKFFKGISHYLGVGTEIAAIATKKLHLHKPATWISSSKFPIIDMKWIAGQYYSQICQFAEVPASQETFNQNVMTVESNLWKIAKTDGLFLIVEDEFQNLFEIKRVFSTRATKQQFINVISENYFLRDYMVNNFQIFETDPKAIPTFVPDFARTERNAVLKLIMMMAHGPVLEETVRKEFMFCGIQMATDTNTNEILQTLIARHCHTQDTTLTVQFNSEVLRDGITSKTVKSFKIEEINSISEYAKILRPAYFLAEDELGEKHYICSKLYGHVFQSYLPGQFTTFEGKYYEVRNITPHNGVILRRAADHINNRIYYRQIRHIYLDSWQRDTAMGSARTMSGIEIINAHADFSVETLGYVETKENNDLKHAHTILLNDIPSRKYKNKSILRIKMPGASEKVLYTICLLLNEIFRTTYPDSWQYIYAVMPIRSIKPEASKHAMYDFTGECEDDCFYILEDSEIDLGLIVSVDRNLKRYFEMICDVLTWHAEKMLETPEPEETTIEEEVIEPAENVEEMPLTLFERIKRFFHNLLNPTISEHYTPTDAVEDVSSGDDELIKDDEDDDIEPETELTEYQKHCFLKYGDAHFAPCLDFEKTIVYLTSFDFNISPLQQARFNLSNLDAYANNYNPNKSDKHYCDFCGCELDKYHTLPDGREQCPECQRAAVSTGNEFKLLYQYVRRNMENIFHIKIDVPVHIRHVSAREMAKIRGKKFKPTPGYDKRTIGLAQHDGETYRIIFETHAPKNNVISTIVHELTHIWQYTHWTDEERNKATNEMYEGMAEWAEIQYMFITGEQYFAARKDVITKGRKDVYGKGYRRVTAKYPIKKSATIITESPFNKFPPL